jgi:membrane protease YdiL (CAAX protease family)
LGEEFGWRGFAHPRLVSRHGLVRGSLILGLGWAAWHLMYSINTSTGSFDWLGLSLLGAELPLYSVIIASVFERSGRSMAVAIAFHAGAHLDNFQRAPRTDLRLQALHVVAALALAIVAIMVFEGIRRKPDRARLD